MSFDCITVAVVGWEIVARKPINHTSWVVIVKPVSNSYFVELIVAYRLNLAYALHNEIYVVS